MDDPNTILPEERGDCKDRERHQGVDLTLQLVVEIGDAVTALERALRLAERLAQLAGGAE